MSGLALPRSRAVRVALAILAAALAVNVLAGLIDAFAPSPGGRPSSSFATAEEGFAAWAELAQRRRITVTAIRERPRDAELPASGTLVVLDAPDVEARDIGALKRFADGGGTLIVGGTGSGRWLGDLLGPTTPEHAAGGPRTARVLAPARETAGVAEVRTDGRHHWTSVAGALPVLGEGDRALLVVLPAGRGRILALADSSPVRNRRLAQADNAALALALAGRGPLVFAESLHGYGTATGLRALPAGARGALILLALAALAFLAAHGRRFGPPEADRRELAPPRAAYVDALAATIARTSEHEQAVAPVRAATLELLRRHTGALADHDVARAAAAAGLTDEEAAVLMRPAASVADVLALGRAHAALQPESSMMRR